MAIDLSSTNAEIIKDLNEKYVKPSGGIPENDLSQSVQDALSKAKTALQDAPVTSVNGKTGAIQLDIPTFVLSGSTLYITLP